MRVAYLLSAPAIGGGNTSLLTLWEGLRRHGVTPLAVCPGPGSMADACRQRGFATAVLSICSDWSEKSSWRQIMGAASLKTLHIRPIPQCIIPVALQ